MAAEEPVTGKQSKGLGFFERYLTVWVALCIVAGIALGKIVPDAAQFLDGLAVYVGDAPVGEHGRLGHLRRSDAGGAARLLHAGDLEALVRLDVGPQRHP